LLLIEWRAVGGGWVGGRRLMGGSGLDGDDGSAAPQFMLIPVYICRQRRLKLCNVFINLSQNQMVSTFTHSKHSDEIVTRPIISYKNRQEKETKGEFKLCT